MHKTIGEVSIKVHRLGKFAGGRAREAGARGNVASSCARSSMHSDSGRDSRFHEWDATAVKKPPVGQLVPVDSDNCERSSGDQRAKRADISLLAY